MIGSSAKRCNGDFGRSLRIALVAGGLMAGSVAAAGEVVHFQQETLATIPFSDSITIRVEGQEERAALRLRAHANSTLTRAHLRPDVAAPLVLALRIEQPLIWRDRDRAPVTIQGRIGSTSQPRYGIEFELPLRKEPRPSNTARYAVLGELTENHSGKVVWRGEAAMKAVSDEGAAALVRLVHRVVEESIRAVRRP